jgi:hypothetical protein
VVIKAKDPYLNKMMRNEGVYCVHLLKEFYYNQAQHIVAVDENCRRTVLDILAILA